MTQEEINNWKGILNISDNISAKDFAKAAMQAGDSILFRIYYHVQGTSNFRVDE